MKSIRKQATHSGNTKSPLISFLEWEQKCAHLAKSNPSANPCVSAEGEEKDIIHGSLLVISQWKDGGGPVKRIQTLFISQNYVSPLWHCSKSKWKSLICCIDSHRSVPPFHTYGACLSLTQRNATLSPCHMAYCVAYSNFRAIWKLTMTNEQALGTMHHLLTMKRIECIFFFWKQQATYCVKHFYKVRKYFIVCIFWAWIC